MYDHYLEAFHLLLIMLLMVGICWAGLFFFLTLTC